MIDYSFFICEQYISNEKEDNEEESNTQKIFRFSCHSDNPESSIFIYSGIQNPNIKRNMQKNTGQPWRRKFYICRFPKVSLLRSYDKAWFLYTTCTKKVYMVWLNQVIKSLTIWKKRMEEIRILRAKITVMDREKQMSSCQREAAFCAQILCIDQFCIRVRSFSSLECGISCNQFILPERQFSFRYILIVINNVLRWRWLWWYQIISELRDNSAISSECGSGQNRHLLQSIDKIFAWYRDFSI